MILEVRPNSGASYGASTSFILPVNKSFDAIKDQAFDVHHNIALPAPIAISSGTVHLAYAVAPACNLGPQTSVPATITFTPLAGFAGFHFDSYTVTAAKKTAASPEYEFDASLLPGSYSVYIQPLPIPGCDDTPPPVFYPSQEIRAGSDGSVGLTDWTVIKPTILEGDIAIPDGGDLTGWRLDMIEPAGGRVVSTQQTLKQGMVALAVNVKLSFVWADTKASPYIRLRPPEGEARPTVYWGLLESLASQSDTKVHLSVANLKIDPREVEIQVVDPSQAGVRSSVQIQSVLLSGDVTQNSSYSAEVSQTDDTGLFKLDLPPGKYQIRATPLTDSTLAPGDLSLTVLGLDANTQGNPCFCGRIISLAKKASVSGAVFTPMGEPLMDATIAMNPSQARPIDFWTRVVHSGDALPLVPRAEFGLADQTGAFGFSVDPGQSDLTVRPGEHSGYAWLVRPRVQVDPAGVQLGELFLPNPAQLRGTVTYPADAGTPEASWPPAPDVIVDAWLPVQNADGTAPTTVVQIGSTTTDESGHYTLILPATISK